MTPPAFTLDLMAKDLDLILELAGEVGARMDQAVQNRETVGRALAAGFEGRDLSAVAAYLPRAEIRGCGRSPGDVARCEPDPRLRRS